MEQIPSFHLNSIKCVRIIPLTEETKKEMTSASGFFCKFNSKIFLVSNYHVFSGKNFQTNAILHPSGAVPGFFNIEVFFVQDKNDKEIALQHGGAREIPLYKKEKPLYRIHPDFGHRIDVAVLDITEAFYNSKFDIESINIQEEIKQTKELSVMDSVFVCGFPIKTTLTPNSFPIYKAATIASEPNFKNSLPIILIDGKTKPGMSGSPVIKKTPLDVQMYNGNLQKIEDKLDFVGIYSGREEQAKDEYQAELGIVWEYKDSLIPILESFF